MNLSFEARQLITTEQILNAPRFGVRRKRVDNIINFFQEKEYGSKPILAQEQLRKRFIELTEGRQVPVVVFNCLDFSWQMSGNLAEYPQSVILDDTSKPITSYFASELSQTLSKLQTLGNPQLTIIIPDSELFDNRVFNYSQSVDERIQIAQVVQDSLTKQLGDTLFNDTKICRWSEYCQQQQLQSPFLYTAQQRDRILSNMNLRKKIKDQVKDSKKHFERYGLRRDRIISIPDEEIFERISWYVAMYAGEGAALADSKALVINLEDMRVASWFQRGADNMLPLLTPVDPTDYYRWRNINKSN